MTTEYNYVTPPEFYDYFGTTDGHAATVERALKAAEVMINTHCGRIFTKNTDLTPRTFRALSYNLCRIDDAIDIALVEVTSSGRGGTFTTFTADDVIEYPALGQRSGLESPVEMIESDYAQFPRGPRCWVKVTPTSGWGWNTVPWAIKEATILQASKFFVRKDSPGGSIAGFQAAGFALKGQDMGLDMDAQAVLNGGYIRSEKMIG